MDKLEAAREIVKILDKVDSVERKQSIAEILKIVATLTLHVDTTFRIGIRV
ncbi:MAG: hypothetical protein HQK96_18760 [Nitrospirae bacterium]|nr:hypothetical protein [Nitrospirota bacterium]